tara:strand:- start:37 stop:183 length:147 start_codon:yes stop_codon:yes gene_type:complete
MKESDMREPTPITCTHCDHEVFDHEYYCPYCGEWLEDKPKENNDGQEH